MSRNVSVLLLMTLMGFMSCTDDYFYEMTYGPSLVSPAPNAVIGGQTVSFVWQAVQNAEAYELLVDGQYLGETKDLMFSAQFAARPDAYCWQIRARNGFQYFPSSSRCFHVSLGIPVLLSPGNGATVCMNEKTFIWESVEGADEYQINLDWVGAFGPHYVHRVPVTQYTFDDNEPIFEGTYRWKVTPVFDGFLASPSEEWVVNFSLPYKAYFTSPAEDFSTCENGNNITFRWSDTSWDHGVSVGSYEFEVWDMNGNRIDAIGLNDTQYRTAPYPAGRYKYRARGQVDGCFGPWSDDRFLEIFPAPVAPTVLNATNMCIGGTGILTFENAEFHSQLDILITGPLGTAQTYINATSPLELSINDLFDGAGTYKWKVIARSDKGCAPDATADLTFNVVESQESILNPRIKGYLCPAPVNIQFHWDYPLGIPFPVNLEVRNSGPLLGIATDFGVLPGYTKTLTANTYNWQVIQEVGDPCPTFLIPGDPFEVKATGSAYSDESVIDFAAAGITYTCDIGWATMSTVCPPAGSTVDIVVTGEACSCYSTSTPCDNYTGGICAPGFYCTSGPEGIDILAAEGWSCDADPTGDGYLDRAVCRWGTTGTPFVVDTGGTFVAPGGECLQCGATMIWNPNDSGCFTFSIDAINC